jgi:hypothetical protein
MNHGTMAGVRRTAFFCDPLLEHQESGGQPNGWVQSVYRTGIATADPIISGQIVVHYGGDFYLGATSYSSKNIFKIQT